MANPEKNSSQSGQQQDESLSATGMFLRAFDAQPAEPESEKEDLGTMSASGANEGRAQGHSETPSQQPGAQKPGAGGGEFTQFFQTLGNKPSAPAPEARAAQSPAPTSRPNPANDAAPGEFTRSFASGGPSSGGHALRSGASPAPSSRSKGFSTPGVTESASAGGSFTQFFKATPAAPKPTPPVSTEPVATESAWKPEPPFRPAEPPPSAGGQGGSVTSILSSLASPSQNAGSPRESDPVAYRTAPVSPAPLTTPAPAASGGDAGGVTRLIKKLAQEPVAAAPPPPAPVVVQSQEPSEFTRMISKIGGPGSPQAAAETPQPAAPAAAGTPVVSVQVQAPQIPQVAPVAPVAAVSAGPKVSSQVNAPHVQPPVMPPAPKFVPPQPPALAVAPPKGKLEAMVPILLVVNTFLLLIVLVVLIFLIKAK